MRYCTNCGQPMGDGNLFCPSCGTKANVPAASTASPAPTQPEPADGQTEKMPAAAPGYVPPAQEGQAFRAPAASDKGVNPVVIAVAAVAAIALIALLVLHPWAPSASRDTSASSISDQGIVVESESAASAESSSASSSSAAKKKQKHDRVADCASTYRLSTVTTSGETLTGVVHRTADDGVIPDMDSKAYSMKELKALKLNDAELCIALNEPLARRGRHFKNSAIRGYFQSCSWYTDAGTTDVDVVRPSALASNYDKVLALVNERGSSYRWSAAVLR